MSHDCVEYFFMEIVWLHGIWKTITLVIDVRFWNKFWRDFSLSWLNMGFISFYAVYGNSSEKFVITRFYSIIEIVGACYITKTAGWHILLTDSQRHTYSITRTAKARILLSRFQKISCFISYMWGLVVELLIWVFLPPNSRNKGMILSQR